jgi:pyridoxine kinase
MATFVMQSLGCEVAALNTVNFSMFPLPLHQAIQFQPFRGNSAGKLSMGSFRYDSISTANSGYLGNHTGYRQFKGTRATAQEISDLYQGLCQSNLTDFDVMLSGYAPSAAVVEAVGAIGIDLQQRAEKKPGSFFWGKPCGPFPIDLIILLIDTLVLDPVMGDQGRLYVNDDVVPAYKNIIHHADLILPNQFEAE